MRERAIIEAHGSYVLGLGDWVCVVGPGFIRREELGTKTLTQKLGMQPGQRVLVLNRPPGHSDRLAPLPEGIVLEEVPVGKYDFVHLFVKDQAELEQLGPSALESVEYDGILWISYPKQSSKVKTDLTRDMGWDVVARAGLRPVTQVSIDETWSALRYRPIERVGKSK